MRLDKVQHLSLGGSGVDRVVTTVEDDGHIVEGILWDRSGRWHAIIDGVPVLHPRVFGPLLAEFALRHGLTAPEDVAERGAPQELTTKTFTHKWQQLTSYGFSSEAATFLFDWYRKKFGLANLDELKAFHARHKRVLECGPGSGFNSRFMAEQTSGEVFALDISAAAFTTFENTRHLRNCTVVQADLMQAPFPDEYFDFIIADGVLHHTPDTRAAVETLYAKLQPGGQFFFYIYKKMGASRYFTDQHIREGFMKLSPDECYAACEGLTELGRELSRLNAKITLEKPIPVLGIPAGTHDVQRLIYYNWVKCFWNEAFDYETNNMVNFDWYHPHNAWQHTQDEAEGWLRDLGAKEWQVNDANPNGISILVTKPI